MTPPPVTAAELRAIDLFDELDDGALDEWLAVVQPRHHEPREVLSEQGRQPEGMLLLIEGRARAMYTAGDAAEPLGRQEAPTWINAIVVLTGGTTIARIESETACRVGIVAAADVRRLVLAQPSVHQRVMAQVAPVMRRLTSLEQNRSRLAALGTMAAGLAHELNNPAAAAGRAAADLAEMVDVVGAALARFVDSGVEREEAAGLVELQQQAAAQAASATALDALDAADAEDELLERLEALGVSEPWRLAEPLSLAGVDQAWLDRVAALAGPATDAALGWVAATVSARCLAGELLEATERMSALVGAVKRYTYMGRGELVEVDLHDGLETTLAVLGHKLKHGSIEVVRDYGRDLPKLSARGAELNQVWTNLLDNAIDALDGNGTITITTRADDGCAVVKVADDGPGIAPEVAARVFDPFFTTKEVGAGSGLGLATARQIVVDRHDGSIAVDSQPGRTTFVVRLPLSLSRA